MTHTSMPCSSHFWIDSWMRRMFSGPTGWSLHAYVGIHAPNLTLATLFSPCEVRAALFPGVPDLESHAPRRHPIRSVDHAGRSARVHARRERLLLAEIDQFAFEDPDLFPKVVGDRVLGVDAGVEAEQTRDIAGLGIAAQDLLLHAGAARSARRRCRDRLPGELIGPEELVLGFWHCTHPQ